MMPMTQTERKRLEVAKKQLEAARSTLDWYYEKRLTYEAMTAGTHCRDAAADIDKILARHQS